MYQPTGLHLINCDALQYRPYSVYVLSTIWFTSHLYRVNNLNIDGPTFRNEISSCIIKRGANSMCVFLISQRQLQNAFIMCGPLVSCTSSYINVSILKVIVIVITKELFYLLLYVCRVILDIIIRIYLELNRNQLKIYIIH